MLSRKMQAVAGVSASAESIVEELYPSMGKTWLGRQLGWLYESLPYCGTVRLSHLLFVLPTFPITLLLYLGMKISGLKYVVTNRRVKIVQIRGGRTLKEMLLGEITAVHCPPDNKVPFFRCGDVYLKQTGGAELVLRGVPRAERFCSVIEEVRAARSSVATSLAAIRNRHQ